MPVRLDTAKTCPHCSTPDMDSHIVIEGDSPSDNPDKKIRTRVHACTFCRNVYATFEVIDQSALKGVFIESKKEQ